MTPWHCTTDHTTWPGCGTCGPCRQAAPAMFDRLRAAAELAAHARKISPTNRMSITVADLEHALGRTTT